ncbi:hypothetical protein M0811_13667 [Anaeramoeba ignava]|uniref:Uncharacterized protein n=1 Tax=Anaeramoeba ignava TaxID=1746090 RepID=A0A9Q0R444_ANAIG|nr:hypothetical protein M0811_13667 [Anaeramoeba ignava]
MKRDNKVLIILFLIQFVTTFAVVIPSLVIASKDKNLDCDKKLWTWILVCNIFLIVDLVFAILTYFSRDYPLIGVFIWSIHLTHLFLLVWLIIGFVWSSSNGIKDQCGKLYSVTLADSICLCVLVILYGCFGFGMYVLVSSALGGV